MMQLSLGIAGTAKNTGKTTTTAAMLEEFRERGIPISLTSIGYDGEDLDNITGLPKPKLKAEIGDIVATAEKCLKASNAGLSILECTDVATPLGKIVIAEVKRPGQVVIAGPNKSTDVRTVSRLLSRLRPGVTIFDGALNRIAPLSETDGFILATGAARTQNIVRLSEETEALAKIVRLAAAPNAIEIADLGLSVVTLFDPFLKPICCSGLSSLLSEEDVNEIFSQIPPDRSQLYVPGIISEQALAALKRLYAETPRLLCLTFQDPMKVLMTGNPLDTCRALDAIEQYGVVAGVLKRVPLFAITVNPFYPEYRVTDNSYREAYVDRVRLEQSIKSRTRLPVYDVIRQGVSGLVDAVLLNQHKWESPNTVTF